jgi:hypothetical protein
MDEGVAAADAVAENSAERWRFSGGRDSETGSSGGTHVAPSERWRSGWDGEFESPLLQRRVVRTRAAQMSKRRPQSGLGGKSTCCHTVRTRLMGARRRLVLRESKLGPALRRPAAA